MIKSVLITGGLGHIGSYLINNMNGDYDITVVDNMYTQRYCSLFGLQRDVRFLDCSFDDLSVEDLNKFDAIIHLAAITNAAKSFKDKETVEYTNIVETKRFIRRADDSDVKVFIFPSSTSVYGKAKDVMREDEDNVDPQSPYARSKVIIEKELKNTKSLNYAILRFGTIFGTSIGMRFHTAINKFCYQAALGKSLTVWKQNYDQHRPYLGLEDAARSVELILESDIKHRETYNVLTDNYKLSEIVEYIKEKVPNLDIDFVDTPLLNQHTYFVSFDKIKNLGYKPLSDLKETIAETMGLLEKCK